MRTCVVLLALPVNVNSGLRKTQPSHTMLALAAATGAAFTGPSARLAVNTRSEAPACSLSRREAAIAATGLFVNLGLASTAEAKPEDYAGGYTDKKNQERLQLPKDGKTPPLNAPKAPPPPPPAPAE